MISRRIKVNLAVFVGLFLLLSYWAVSNVVKFDVIERPYRVTAYFATSPGLRPGFEVAFLGLRVGSIGSVELIDDPTYCSTGGEPSDTGEQADTGACVAVELKIDRGTELPGNVTPFVRRKSAVGEPYVDLVVAAESGEGRLEGGDHLPNGHIPLAYSDLFNAVNDLVQAVPEDSLGIFFRELADGLEGRSDDIRRLLEGAHDLTGTLADEPELLQELTDQLTALTHTFATHRDSFGSAVDNVAAFAEALAANRDRLAAFLDTTPQFAAQLADVLDAAGGDLTCALRSLSVVAGSLAQPDRLSQVERLLDAAAGAGSVLAGSVRQLPDGTWITGGFQFNVANGAPVPTYAEPTVLPEPPALRACELAVAPGSGSGTGAGTAGGGTAGGSAGSSPGDATDRPAAPGAAIADSTDDEADDPNLIGDLLPFAAGVAVLALLAAVLKPWRWFGVGRNA